MSESAISHVQERMKKQTHEGKVTFLSRNRKQMTLLFPTGVSETINVEPRVRFGEFSLGNTVRIKASDHVNMSWNKVEGTEEAKKERVKRKHATFDFDLLKSSKGLPVIADKFPKIKFKGPGYESADLRKLMECYKDWASELYPKFSFHHTVRKLEMMGSTKDVKMYMSELRLDYEMAKQDEAHRREQEQVALHPQPEVVHADVDEAKRRRMEENKQNALARLAQKRLLQGQASEPLPAAAEDDQDVDAAIADQNEFEGELLGEYG